MKRLLVLIVALCALSAGRSFAQDTHVITLDQANPIAQISITLPQNSTGVVSINLNMASVQMTDTSNNVVFSAADSRVHLVQLSIAPNTGAHLLTVQPLPGAATATLQVSSQADLTSTTTASFVNVSDPSLQQSQPLLLTTQNPRGTVNMVIPQDLTTGVLTATFPGVTATAQVTDSGGVVVASSNHDIDGFNLVLDSGGYVFNLAANPLTNPITANVSVMPANQFSLLSAAPSPTPTAAAVLTQPCIATITASSANLRSGPGRGYTVLNFAYLGNTFTVGGVNADHSWLVVAGDQGSAWLSGTLAQLSGDCTNLQVFNVSFLNAQPAQINIEPAPTTSVNNATSGASNPPQSNPPPSGSRGGGDDGGSDN
jgi:SH3-like domain-containing protein